MWHPNGEASAAYLYVDVKQVEALKFLFDRHVILLGCLITFVGCSVKTHVDGTAFSIFSFLSQCILTVEYAYPFFMRLEMTPAATSWHPSAGRQCTR